MTLLLLAVPALAAPVDPQDADWERPIQDARAWGQVLVDQLEVRTLGPAPEALATDIEGWYGGDYHRLRFRLEGDAVVGPAGEGEAAVAYSRLVGPWVELQAGIGAEGRIEGEAGGEARIEVGVEAVVPYDFDFEATLRLSHRGRASARVTLIKELLLTQRLVAQARIEATSGYPASPGLDRAAGLESAAAGLRVRYELVREFGPYVGAQWGGGLAAPSVGGSGFVQQIQAVAGVRAWY